ncbi:MAG: riboflavin biosynthesis protein RibF [Firmicutes bacterium]|nr:riboflavin biosynthesis protein RibF [Bacillota bacterium]
MKICNQLSELESKSVKTTVALGTFDGVHIGHQKIIGQAVDMAKQTNTVSVVFTFQNHPLSVIDPDQCPPQIDSLESKTALIKKLGVDILLQVPITDEFLNLSPDKFIDLLCQYLNPACLVVGPNYSYGYKGAGDHELLKKAGLKRGFAVIVHPPVYVGNTLVSSTTIRQYIQAGKVELAAELLGRPHQIKGPVINGDKRGRELGFPTANLSLQDGCIMPNDGVYAVYVDLDGRKYPAVANIGNNPTFNGVSHRTEIHIIDFAQDLYGQQLIVAFMAKIRDEVKFSGIEELKKQLSHDIKTARQYLK